MSGAKGFDFRGEGHHAAVLTEDQVRAIRDDYQPCGCCGHRPGYGKLAEKYGISHITVRNIVLRNTWAHVA